jgi:UDP-glucuronate decarboxylase
LWAHTSAEGFSKKAMRYCASTIFFTGSRKNIIHLPDYRYFEVIRHDITTPFYAEVDEIYISRMPASPVHYQYNPIKTIKTSVMGAINMLGLAKRIKAKILQAINQ